MEKEIEETIKIAKENVEVDDDIINAYLCGAVEMKYIMKKKLKGLDWKFGFTSEVLNGQWSSWKLDF